MAFVTIQRTGLGATLPNEIGNYTVNLEPATQDQVSTLRFSAATAVVSPTPVATTQDKASLWGTSQEAVPLLNKIQSQTPVTHDTRPYAETTDTIADKYGSDAYSGAKVDANRLQTTTESIATNDDPFVGGDDPRLNEDVPVTDPASQKATCWWCLLAVGLAGFAGGNLLLRSVRR